MQSESIKIFMRILFMKLKSFNEKKFLFFVAAAIRRKLSNFDLTIFIAINPAVEYKNQQNKYYKYVMPNYNNR